MCIVCKAKSLANVQLEMVDTLVTSIDQCTKIIARAQASGFVLNETEVESLRITAALVRAESLDAMPPCPEGFPPAVWATMPREVQDLLTKAVAAGATLTSVDAEELLAEAERAMNSTKH